MISVIIPTFNEARHLPATLDAIQRNQSAHEVIAVDAGSFDATIKALECVTANLSLWL